MLELENVSTSYGQVQMLRGLSMNVRKGELVCLLGPNGAGKSTTFKALSGLLSLDGGAVRMLGEDVARAGTEGLTALGVGFAHAGRPAGKNQGRRMHFRHLRGGGHTGMDFGIHPGLAHAAGNELGDLGAVVDDNDFAVRHVPSSPVRASSRCGSWALPW